MSMQSLNVKCHQYFSSQNLFETDFFSIPLLYLLSCVFSLIDKWLWIIMFRVKCLFSCWWHATMWYLLKSSSRTFLFYPWSLRVLYFREILHGQHQTLVAGLREKHQHDNLPGSVNMNGSNWFNEFIKQPIWLK